MTNKLIATAFAGICLVAAQAPAFAQTAISNFPTNVRVTPYGTYEATPNPYTADRAQVTTQTRTQTPVRGHRGRPAR